jgi:hypothetical protein
MTKTFDFLTNPLFRPLTAKPRFNGWTYGHKEELCADMN